MVHFLRAVQPHRGQGDTTKFMMHYLPDALGEEDGKSQSKPALFISSRIGVIIGEIMNSKDSSKAP